MTWWRRLSLRARLMLVGTGGLALGFLLGGVLLIGALGLGLQRSVDGEARATAQGVADLVDVDTLPTPLAVAGDQIVQVIDGQGRVLSYSVAADPLVPLLRADEMARVRGGGALSVDAGRVGGTGPLRVVAVPAGPGRQTTVLVAVPVGDVFASVRLIRTGLLIAFPLLVALIAAVAWRVLGAALRPVEALRAGAEAITGSGRAGRLPVPASADEIRRLAVTLNDMLDRLDAARARQRAFVADAAHELRSPLANLRVELEVAERLAEPPDVAALLTDTARLSRLVDDLLLLARADEALPPRRSEPVELAGLLRQVVDRYGLARVPVRLGPIGPGGSNGRSNSGDAGRSAGGPEHGPDGGSDGGFWSAGDPDALGRAVGNLVDNAVRHAANQVTVSVLPDGECHLITVVDDGPGIPLADRERVFDRFTRLDDARGRDGGGAGLGLAIVRELVRRHGGSVRLTDPAAGAPTCPPTGALTSAATGTLAGAATEALAGVGAGLRAELRLPRMIRSDVDDV